MLTGIVLAGGRGTRFGSDKLLIKLKERYILEIIIEKLKLLTDEIIIVTSPEKHAVISKICKEGRIVKDLLPGKAAIGGIYTGLFYANNTYSLVVACDMPALNSDLLQYMIDEMKNYDIVVPYVGNYLEPLHAVYSINCLPVILEMINKNNLKIDRLFQVVHTRYITNNEIENFDPDHLSIFNINTQRDMNRACHIL